MIGWIVSSNINMTITVTGEYEILVLLQNKWVGSRNIGKFIFYTIQNQINR